MGSTSRFRFRDQGIGNSSEFDTSLESSLGSGGHADDDSDLQSMTAKGIQRLCSELLELQQVSDDDFHKNVYSNHSEFVRIFKEAEVIENDLMELKKHLLTQRRLVRDLMDGIYLDALSEELNEPNTEEDSASEPCSLGTLEAHTDTIKETLDVLLSEHRLDEALLILEREPITLQNMQSLEDFPPETVTSHNNVIMEMRKRLADQFAMVAEHPRTAGPELQKSLSGLCRLGDHHRANLLLLQFYRSHLACCIHDLQHSKPYLHKIYIRELAKFVFSVISQAATSFISLYGETSPYASELILWARKETENFVRYFERYVKSISETTGGLSLAVESVKHAISFCSMLDSQRILLRLYLIKLIRPCMEGVLQMHMDHLKKVIDIFTGTDSWVLSKFLISGLLRDKHSYTVTDGEVEFCLLTKSGRKFITMVQGIIQDISPLVILQMGSSIIKGVAYLFNEYIDILKRSIPCKPSALEGGVPRSNLAKTLYQQLSLLANSCTVVLFFSSFSGNIFKVIKNSYDERSTENTEHYQRKELDNGILSVQETGDQLRGYFCEQFVLRVISSGQEPSPETYDRGQIEYCSLKNHMPSAAFQVLFLQLRQLEKLAKDIFVGVDWLLEELLRELMEAVFVWLLNNQEFWTGTRESSIIQQSSNFNQFLLDMQFLLEIARFGGYFTDKLMDTSITLIDRMETAFIEAGLDPIGDILDDGCATQVAKAVIDKLLETEKTSLPPAECSIGNCEVYSDNEQWRDSNDSAEDDAWCFSDDSINRDDGEIANAAALAISKLQDMEKAEVMLSGGSADVLEEDGSCEEISQSSTENAVITATNNPQEANKTRLENLEEYVSYLLDDCNKQIEEIGITVKYGKASCSNEPFGLSDEQFEAAAPTANEEIDDLLEPRSADSEGTKLVVKDDFYRELLGNAGDPDEENDSSSPGLRENWDSNVLLEEHPIEPNAMELPDREG